MDQAQPDDKRLQLPAVIARNEKIVREGFWVKLRRLTGRIPFAEDLAAAYFCAMDSRTPLRVRAVLLGAAAYFVIPTDLLPDIVAGVGFTDDATVLMTAIGLVSSHIKDRHRERARETLFLPEPPRDGD